MRMVSAMRYAASAVALGGIGLLAFSAAPRPAEGQTNFVQNGEAGFVVSDIAFALSEHADTTGACPDGYSLGGSRLGVARRTAVNLLTELGAPQAQIDAIGPVGGAAAFGFGAPPGAGQGGGAQGQRPAAQAPAAGAQTPGQGQAQRAGQGQGQGGGFAQARGPNPCANPEQFGPDPLWRSVETSNVPVYGIDLDGQNSTANGRPAPGTCAHSDFRGFHGERGIDNQFFRAVGCTRSYQTNGSTVPWAIEMLTGAWGILIRLRGVDDIRNDPEVIVDLAANADPIQLSANREPLVNVTYAMMQDPRFRTTARGRIVNGVLTTEPVNFRWWKITNGVYFERPLDDARIRMTISPNGTLDGYLAGYTSIEDIYNFQFGMAHGTNGAGEPRVGAGGGAAATLGYSCNGAYYALQAAADGHRDPATGRCTAISTQYRLRAISAFVVDAPTRSVNTDLTPAGGRTANGQ